MKKLMIMSITILALFTVSIPALAADKSSGGDIYKKHCIGCHGSEGRGDGPAAKTLNPKPTNFIAPGYKDSTGKNPKEYSEAELFEIVRFGRRGTAMPKWGHILKQEEIADVVSYIRGLD